MPLSQFVVDCPNCGRPMEFPLQSVSNEPECGRCRRELNAQHEHRQHTMLLVEQRDDVFVRFATEIARTGTRVIRARSAAEALERAETCNATIVVANVAQRDQSGWLLAAKMNFIDRHIHIWLYQPSSSNVDRGMAEFLNVERLLSHGGNIFRMSHTIRKLLEALNGATNATAKEELSVA
jgi:DNA-binding NtrC family response regulator